MACETTGVKDWFIAACNSVIQLGLQTVCWRQMALSRLKDKCSLYKSILYQPYITLIMFGKSFETPLVTGRTLCDGAHCCWKIKAETH